MTRTDVEPRPSQRATVGRGCRGLSALVGLTAALALGPLAVACSSNSKPTPTTTTTTTTSAASSGGAHRSHGGGGGGAPAAPGAPSTVTDTATQTDTQTATQTDTQTATQTDTQTATQTSTQTSTQTVTVTPSYQNPRGRYGPGDRVSDPFAARLFDGSSMIVQPFGRSGPFRFLPMRGCRRTRRRDGHRLRVRRVGGVAGNEAVGFGVGDRALPTEIGDHQHTQRRGEGHE